VLPAPVWLVGVYDEERRPNIMALSWGGLCCSFPPCLAVSVRRTAWTWKALRAHGAFTVSIPSRDMAAKVDFAGLVSGEVEDKFGVLGFTAQPADHVDAPYVTECPVILELVVRHSLELGSHTQFVGEIMDVKISPACLRPDGLPDPDTIDALTYVPLVREYYAAGSFLARAFSLGRMVRRPVSVGDRTTENL